MSLKAFKAYLKLERNYSPHTIKAYTSDIKDFCSHCLTHYQTKDCNSANYAMIRNWIMVLVEQGISNQSINRKITALKSYFKFLLKIEEIPHNPLAKHKALKSQKKIQIPFSEFEMSVVLEATDYNKDFLGLRDKLMIELLYSTGIRRAELVGLKLTDIDLSNKTLKVMGKRRKERIIPLIPHLIKTIESYLTKRKSVSKLADKEYLLLTKTGHKVYETLVYRVINKYLSMVSVKVKKSPHVLRHTFATHLLNQGANLNAVKELLGHSSLASTQVYTHSSIVKLKKVHATSHPRNKK